MNSDAANASRNDVDVSSKFRPVVEQSLQLKSVLFLLVLSRTLHHNFASQGDQNMVIE